MSNELLQVTDNGIAVNGELTFATVKRLLQDSPVLFEDKKAIDIDLRNVDRTDSAGLALLVEWTARAQRENVDIRFSNVPKQMSDIARLTEVETLLPIAG